MRRSTILFVFLFSVLFSCKLSAQEVREKAYFCPPCGSPCDDEKYSNPGPCPVCRMHLILENLPEVKMRFKIDTSDVWIRSHEVQLRASYYVPRGLPEPLPAAVIVHGSAPSTRHDLRFHTELCLNLGLAVLAFDKRGVGESTGTFKPFSVEESDTIFSELAADASAALQWLKSQKEVDATRIGMVGGSQAGWIMPLAATETDEVRFIVIFAGTPLSAGEEAYHGRLLGEGRTVEETDRLVARYEGAKGFDPRPILQQSTAKMLWIFGSNDVVIPTNPSIAEMSRIMEHNSNHEMHIIDGADHNFISVETGEPYSTDAIISAWLQKHAIIQ